MKTHVAFALAAFVAAGIAPAGAQQPAAASIEAHLVAAKKAAGFDFPGLLAALCIGPRNAPPRDVPPGPPPPNRASQYTEPAKVFDDVYFVGGVWYAGDLKLIAAAGRGGQAHHRDDLSGSRGDRL